MKTIIALAALGLLSTAAMSAPRNDCWQATGNWNGGQQFTNCPGNSGGGGWGPNVIKKKCAHKPYVKNN